MGLFRGFTVYCIIWLDPSIKFEWSTWEDLWQTRFQSFPVGEEGQIRTQSFLGARKGLCERRREASSFSWVRPSYNPLRAPHLLPKILCISSLPPPKSDWVRVWKRRLTRARGAGAKGIVPVPSSGIESATVKQLRFKHERKITDFPTIPISSGLSRVCLKIPNPDQYAIGIRKIPISTRVVIFLTILIKENEMQNT